MAYCFLGNNSLTLSGTSVITGTFSASNMIITNGTGQLIKLFPSASSFTFPVGDNSPAYSPCLFNYSAGTFSGATSLGVRVTNGVESNLTSTDKLNRYWTLTDNISGGVGNATFNYNASDVGTEANLIA